MTPALLASLLVVTIGLAVRPVAPARSLGADPAGPVRAVIAGIGFRSRVPRRGRAADPAQVAAWCDTLSRSLRGRATLGDALRSSRGTPAIEYHLAPVRLAIDRGTPLADALAAAVGRDPHLDVALITLRTCAVHGGATAEPIDRVGAALRQRAALAAERRGQSAQARLSAHVMTALPGVLLAVMVASSSSVRATIRSPLGMIVLILGAGLNGLGWWWMRRLIDGAGR